MHRPIALLVAALAATLSLAVMAASPAHAEPTADAPPVETVEPTDQPEAEPVPGNLVHFDTQGKRFSLSDYVKLEGEFPPFKEKAGSAVIVFGAHWCEPCKEVIKALAAQRDALVASKIHVLYIHVDDKDRSDGLSQKDIRAHAEEMAKNPDYADVHVLLGGDMAEVRTWMNDTEHTSLPGIIVISAGGQIVARPTLATLAQALQPLLAADPPVTP